MEETKDNITQTYNIKLIAKNTIFNLLGYCVPLLFALILIPSLLKSLGTERFGILNLVWIIVGYASFLDFGLGKGLTKIIAEKIALNQSAQVPNIFWTSLILMLGISIAFVLGLLFFVPEIVNVFNLTEEIKPEIVDIFYLLILSIPIVSTTAGLRGFLEAYQEFGIINIMRVFLGIFTFLGPLIILFAINSLFWVVFFLIFIRVIMWGLYLLQCFRINRNLKVQFGFNSILVKPLLQLSSWITIANIVGPLIVYIDRFLIGAIASTTAIAFYSTPYEITSKLLLIPTALTGVLFPIFSSSYISTPEFSKKIFFRSIKFTFWVLFPAVFFIVAFSYEGMELWLGKNFAVHSSFILQLMAVGVFFNSLAFIPFNFFQGIGKPNIPAIVNLIELPFYVIIMWTSIKYWGINGAAFVWLCRIIIDTVILFYLSNKIISISPIYRIIIATSLTILSLILPLLIGNLIYKSILVIVELIFFYLITWKYLLTSEERTFINSKLRLKFI